MPLGVDTAAFTPVERKKRAARNTTLIQALKGLERGRRPEAGRDLRARLRPDMDRAAFVSALETVRGYGEKCPDADLEEKLAAQARLGQYAVNLGLFDQAPDFVFTHVTRFVPSKAMWRDVRVLEHLDKLLTAKKKRAVLYILASALPGGRRVRDVYEWEQTYGWPVVHRAGNGDLQGDEVEFYQLIETFNANARAIRIVLVNQFG